MRVSSVGSMTISVYFVRVDFIDDYRKGRVVVYGEGKRRERKNRKERDGTIL